MANINSLRQRPAFFAPSLRPLRLNLLAGAKCRAPLGKLRGQTLELAGAGMPPALVLRRRHHLRRDAGEAGSLSVTAGGDVQERVQHMGDYLYLL